MTLESITDTIVTMVANNRALAVPIVFALAFGESLAFISLLLPATSILLALSVLFGAGGVSFVSIWLAATVGSILGYGLSYWIGYTYKAEIRGFWPFRNNPDLLARGEAFFDKYGAYGVFLGHFLGPIRAVIPVVAGMCAMKQVPFLVANVASSVLWSAGVLAPNLVAGNWPMIKAVFGQIFGVR
jgi:membrane protein DedA with SNARE-associated domain